MSDTSLGVGLYAAILDFWGLLLLEESWPLNTPSAQFQIHVDSPHSSVDGMEDVEETEVKAEAMEVDEGSTGAKAQTEPPEPPTWDQVRSLLGKQRDRFCIWKAILTNDELNEITGDESSLLGASILECLVSIADSLLEETVYRAIKPDYTKDQLDVLEDLRLRGKERIKKLEGDDLRDRDSLWSNSIATTVGLGENLLSRLTDNIWRLERLSYTMRLALRFGST